MLLRPAFCSSTTNQDLYVQCDCGSTCSIRFNEGGSSILQQGRRASIGVGKAQLEEHYYGFPCFQSHHHRADYGLAQRVLSTRVLTDRRMSGTNRQIFISP
jgi:hypothetical protein